MKKILLIVFVIISLKSFGQTSSRKLINNSIKKMERYFTGFLGKEFTKRYVALNKSNSRFRTKTSSWLKFNDTSKVKNAFTVTLQYTLVDNGDTLINGFDYKFDYNGKCYVFEDTSVKDYKEGVEYTLLFYKNYFSNQNILRYKKIKETLIENGYQNDTLKIENINLSTDTAINSQQIKNKEKLNTYVWIAEIYGWIKRPNYAANTKNKFYYGWWPYKYVYVDAFTGKILKEEILKYDDNKMPMPL